MDNIYSMFGRIAMLARRAQDSGEGNERQPDSTPSWDSAIRPPTYAQMLRLDLSNCGRPPVDQTMCPRPCTVRRIFKTAAHLREHRKDGESTPPFNSADYELAGCDPSNTFRDLRSGRKARERYRAKLEKYYGYRGVNPGQLGAEHHRSTHLTCSYFDCPLQESETTIMTKQMLYYEAQRYPRPPTYHRRHVDKIYGNVSQSRERRMKARKHQGQVLDALIEEDGHEEMPYAITGLGEVHGDSANLCPLCVKVFWGHFDCEDYSSDLLDYHEYRDWRSALYETEMQDCDSMDMLLVINDEGDYDGWQNDGTDDDWELV